MHGNRYTVAAAVAILIVAILFLIVLLRPSGERAARDTVERFGLQMQKVSLLAPDAAEEIDAAYGMFVDPALLAMWEAGRTSAPGRETSSPYPDHIDIGIIAPQGSGFVISGSVVHMTSTGEAGRTPVVIQVIKTNGGYQIVAYQEQKQ